jgi:hypothetical protein
MLIRQVRARAHHGIVRFAAVPPFNYVPFSTVSKTSLMDEAPGAEE